MKKNLVYIGNNLRRKDTNPTYMQALAKKLSQTGYSLTLASGKTNKVARILDMLKTVWSERKALDYVLIDTYSTQNFYYAIAVGWLCRKLKLDYIPILHGGNLPNRLKKSPRLSKSFFNGSKINISPSAYLQEQFNKAGFSNIACIPNAISLEQFKFKERTKLQPNLLWVRSFVSIYNPLMAVHTAIELSKIVPNVSLCMAGPEVDSSLKACRELARISDVDIQFKGKLTREEWTTLAADYAIFINTANFDNTPLSVIEAMALGLPIVSTNVGGMPYLINNNKDGILVANNNPKAMAQAIAKLLTDSTMANTLCKNAQAKANSFDWLKVLPLWEAVLK